MYEYEIAKIILALWVGLSPVENILGLSESPQTTVASRRKERRLPHTFPNSRLTAAPSGVGSLGADRAGRAIAGKRDCNKDAPILKAVPTTISWAD
jgi:hypothetical protein